MADKLVDIAVAAKILGVSKTSLRRWEKSGKLIPIRTSGGHRRYELLKINMLHNLPPDRIINNSSKQTIAYARVSSNDQKIDLERQKQVLEMYCATQGWSFEIIADLGSGMNYYKKGLTKLISEIVSGDVGRLVLTHKDRLLRFGAELIFAICEIKQVEIVIINKGIDTSFEEDLAKDVLEIITVFSARLYGSRSGKNKKLIDGIKQVAENADNKSQNRTKPK